MKTFYVSPFPPLAVLRNESPVERGWHSKLEGWMYANPLPVPPSRDTGHACKNKFTFMGPSRHMSLELSVTHRQSVLFALLILLIWFSFYIFFCLFMLTGNPKHPESIWGLVVFWGLLLLSLSGLNDDIRQRCHSILDQQTTVILVELCPFSKGEKNAAISFF